MARRNIPEDAQGKTGLKAIHNQEKQQFRKLFSQENIDRFEDRYRILEILLQTEHHLSEAEVTEMLNENGHDFSPALIRETLDLMCHFGFLHANRFDNGRMLYEHRHLGQHHDHMICTKCGRIEEFTNESMESLQRKIAADSGFHMLQHRMEIYGICRDCLKERIPILPLTAARQGERLVVREVAGGSNVRVRLMTMGLRVGDEIEVITNLSAGQVVVALDHNRLALGRGLADKIMVRALDSQEMKAAEGGAQ